MLHALILSLGMTTSLAASPLKEGNSASYNNHQAQNHTSFREGQKLAGQMLSASPPIDVFKPSAGAGEKPGCPSQWRAAGGKEPDRGDLKDPFPVKEEGAVDTHDSHLYVFVSFSMPLQALKDLSLQAEKHQARLIVRGLIDNSFRTTVQKLSDFKSGLEINPTLFKEFKVKTVPTFVLVEKGQEKSRICGNVSLAYAAEQLKGDA